jgi:cytochrome oxidase Cu insertion factor (SCO1/SenC/PrrC family)
MIYIYDKPNNLHGIIDTISENQSSIFLIDPLGNVILKYNEEFQGKKLLKDIKKLLKLSRIG